MSLAATIRAMKAAGFSSDQIVTFTIMHQEELERADAAKREAKRAGNRDRQAARRARNEAVVNDVRIVSNDVTDNTDGKIGNVGNAVTPCDTPLHGVTERDGRDVVSLEVSPNDNNLTPFLDLSGESYARKPPENRGLAAKADEFYLAYPKKVEPKDAKARFIRLAKSGVDPDHMIAACRRYAEAQRLAGTEKKFIPAPAVWLNRGGYDSEDLPQPARAPPSREADRRPTIFDAARQRLENRNSTPDDDLPAGESGGIRRDPIRLLSANGRGQP